MQSVSRSWNKICEIYLNLINSSIINCKENVARTCELHHIQAGQRDWNRILRWSSRANAFFLFAFVSMLNVLELLFYELHLLN